MACGCDPANTLTACEAQKLQARWQMSYFGDQDIIRHQTESSTHWPTGHPFQAAGYTEGNERFD